MAFAVGGDRRCRRCHARVPVACTEASATSATSTFVAIEPVRLLDTRVGTGLNGPFVSDTARQLEVAGASVRIVGAGA